MRIIGEIPHHRYKVTLMRYEDRITVQIANGPLSHSYRFQETVFESAKIRDRLLEDQAFWLQVDEVFRQMDSNWVTLQQSRNDRTPVFEEII